MNSNCELPMAGNTSQSGNELLEVAALDVPIVLTRDPKAK